MIRIAPWLLIALLIPVHAFAANKIIWELSEHQPDTREGGRANSVAVNPTNGDELLAASDTGGLFKSTDRGLSWTHVDSLPVSFTQAVVYVSSTVILVSAKADFKTANGGGIWRSENGGLTWKQATLSGPEGRLSAFGISASGNDVIVGTSDGVFVSTDGGESWTWSDPYGAIEVDVVSVLVTPGRTAARLYAGGAAEMKLNTLALPLGPWTTPTSAVPGLFTLHAFRRSPVASSHAFVLAGHNLMRTENNGVNWTGIPLPPNTPSGCGGATFVQAALNAVDGRLDLYLGDVCELYRLTVPYVGTTVDYSGAPGAWQLLDTDRSGMCDLAILDREPVLLATAGGLHTTANDGATWTYVASGRQGYGALQLTEVKGQFIESAGENGETDLYFSTRNNYFWTADTGANVQGHRDEEAFYVEAERRVPSTAESRITWRNDDAETLQSGQDLLNPTAWPGPAGGSKAPVFVARDVYAQNRNGGLDWTLNAGTTWQTFASFSESSRGLPRFARSGLQKGATILYQAFPASGGAIRLLRAHHFNGTGSVVHPAMTGFKTLGVRRTIAEYPVFGVDSAAWDHVIAADVGNERVLETADGGESWTEIPLLTSLVTDNGRLLFDTSLDGGETAPLVTAISFSPQDPSLAVIGTAENGILVSSNRGVTWRKLESSERATHVTSFFWEDANTVYVSTYGRGLWKLTNRRIEVADTFDQFCATCDVLSNDGGPERPPFDNSVLVFEGRILGVRTDNRRLREVFVTPGSSVLFTGDLKDEQGDIAITEGTGKNLEPLPEPPDGWIATGVVFTSDDILTGTAFAESEMSLLPPESEEP